MNMHKSHRLRDAVEALYAELTGAGIEVLLDDRVVRPGVMFADSELLGIPYRVVLGDRGLDAGTCEFRHRCDAESVDVALDGIVEAVSARVRGDLQASGTAPAP
jgi:prolyl-tRNA synthetase